MLQGESIRSFHLRVPHNPCSCDKRGHFPLIPALAGTNGTIGPMIQSSIGTELRKLILPIASKLRENGTIRCHGTGFVILAYGRHAYMVTAAHVIEAIRRIESPHLVHHPTTPEFFIPVRYLLQMRRVIPFVFFQDENVNGYPAIIQQCVEMKKADIALCSIEFPEYVPPNVQITTRLWLDTAPVKVGDSVRAFGYSNMTVSPVEPGENIEGFKANWLVETGIVKEVYPTTGPTGQEHPCFQISSTLVGGMSGGPVMTIGRRWHSMCAGGSKIGRNARRKSRVRRAASYRYCVHTLARDADAVGRT